MSDRRSVTFFVRDVSGQKATAVRECPFDASVGEVVPSVVALMEMPPRDPDGNPLSHVLRRDRDGAVLHEADVVGDVLEEDEQCVIQPSIDAG